MTAEVKAALAHFFGLDILFNIRWADFCSRYSHIEPTSPSAEPTQARTPQMIEV